MDSFRVLARRERMIAMVDEAMPPPLDQQLPNSITVSDASELGLIGGVRRTRETTQLSPKSEKLFSRELRFDQNGFILRDIQFNTGYPEVITSWGWLSGSRINMQSPMNFFDEDRPMGSRNVTTSGFSPTISTTRPRYGNRFEVGYDTSGRIHWRKCFTNSGSLVSIENFKYDRDWREIKSTDSSGGFLSAVRERFDRNHNLIEAQTLFDTGRIVSSTRFEYQFDAQGNWIVKKVFRGTAKSPSKPTETYYREIEYFDATLLKNWN
ncbi:MAG: hypothetical protein IPG58_12030 [Acidobacteria bacterium]|nr:hypothetical protein [Acidobacteriota bacterium]